MTTSPRTARAAGEETPQILEDWVERYENTAAGNDAIFAAFTEETDRTPWLKAHRDWVEKNRWGYGDRAFHHMWKLIVEALILDCKVAAKLSFLEIGVFKGQTLSLWTLIAQQMGFGPERLDVTGISPLEGNTKPQPRWLRSLRKRFSRRYREAAKVGNLHNEDDYAARVGEIFAAFTPGDKDSQPAPRLIKGYSNDPAIAGKVAEESFDLVYIDGDHSLEVAQSDIQTYGPLVREGGFLVVDDAAWFLPGETFWKGFETVSRACEDIPALGFENILNIGHNRVYRRRGGP